VKRSDGQKNRRGCRYLRHDRKRPVEASAFWEAKPEERPKERAWGSNYRINKQVRNCSCADAKKPGIAPSPGKIDTRKQERCV
jgi:hypothetical protein